MPTKKVLIIALFVFVGFFATCICFAIAVKSNGNRNAEEAATTHINTHYELPKLIPAAWYVGK